MSGWDGWGRESSYLVLETAFRLNVVKDLSQFFLLEAALQTEEENKLVNGCTLSFSCFLLMVALISLRALC
jgi:hypothetical protein